MLLFGSYTTSFFLLCAFTLGQHVLSQTGSNCTAGYHCTEQCYSDDCKLKNVALCKSVDSSSLKPFHQLACAAVDGITGTDYGCVETVDDNNTFWRVDLGQTFTIPNITLYGRSWWFLRMLGIRVFVGDQLCHTIGTESFYVQKAGPPVPIHVQCNPPLTGRDVTLVKNCTGTGSCQQHSFSLCEVQVWATQSPPAPPTTTTTPSITPSTSILPSEQTHTEPTTNEDTCLPVAVVAGSVGAAVAVVIAVNILVFVVMRKRRGKNGTNNNNKTDGVTPAAEYPGMRTGDKDPVSTTDNVDEITEESGHYYEQLNHKYDDDNRLYTNPVFTKGEE